MDFSKTLIRASQLGDIMTKSKSKNPISKTAEGALIDIGIEKKYGRQKEIDTAPMRKGTKAEEESIDILSLHHGKMFTKHEGRKKNKWITGEPDIVTDDAIHDIKTSWSIHTFMKKKIESLSKAYTWQGQAYMWLFDKEKAFFHFCLTNTPDEEFAKEVKILGYKFKEGTDDYNDAYAKLEKNHFFDDIPTEERIITFDVLRDNEKIESIKPQVEACRDWLKLHFGGK